MEPIINPLLAYAIFSVNSGTISNISKAISGYFTLDEVCTAKTVLFTACTQLSAQNRRGSVQRSEKVAHIDDILAAIVNLDASDDLPNVCISAKDLGRIPRSHPEELNDITLIDRLNQMEKKMSTMQSHIDSNMANHINLSDMVRQITKPMPVKSFADATAERIQIIPDPLKVHADAAIATTSIPQPVKAPSSNPAKHPAAATALQAGDLAADPKKPNTSRTPQDKRSMNSTNTVIRGKQSTDGYLVVHRKKRQVTIGKANNKHDLKLKGAPEPKRFAFIYRVDNTVSEADVKDYMNSENIAFDDITCMSNELAKFKSFKLCIPISSVKRVFDPDTWPENVYVRKFILPKEKDGAA